LEYLPAAGVISVQPPASGGVGNGLRTAMQAER